jgi:hypothetical protein
MIAFPIVAKGYARHLRLFFVLLLRNFDRGNFQSKQVGLNPT